MALPSLGPSGIFDRSFEAGISHRRRLLVLRLLSSGKVRAVLTRDIAKHENKSLIIMGVAGGGYVSFPGTRCFTLQTKTRLLQKEQ